MKLFLDTNVWLRYLVSDNEVQHAACRRLVELIEGGEIKAYSSAIVFLEVGFVLKSVYGIEKEQVIKDIESLLKLRQLVLIEKTDLREAIGLHKKTKVKLVDCVVAGQITEGVWLCSFDKEFGKIKGLKMVSPTKAIELVDENDKEVE